MMPEMSRRPVSDVAVRPVVGRVAQEAGSVV
jgi:hypothetical protein